MNTFNQPKNPLTDFYIQDQLIISIIQKLDHKIFILEGGAGLINISRKVEKKTSQSIIVSKIFFINLSMNFLKDIKTSYSSCKYYYCKEYMA